MEQLFGFAAIMFVVVLASTLALAVVVKVYLRPGKVSTNAAGNLFTEAGHNLEAVLAGTLTHGQKIGKVIDATDELGTLLTRGGYMAEAEWQPLADKITSAVATKKHVVAAAEGAAA